MARFSLQQIGCQGPRTSYGLLRTNGEAYEGSLAPVDPDPAVLFTFGNLEPKAFSSFATWKRWFEAQGHTVEVEL